MMQHIRNFSIIAHIDHGKSTLADRMLEVTGTVDPRQMRSQVLDTMELERERGITIKLQPARMSYKGHFLNLIDTPGHVDFSYEVSRSLAAVEGVILLVDATQGVQAQTIANLQLATKQNLKIIPVINKIDLPAANPQKVIDELKELFPIHSEDVIRISAKTGEGVTDVLDAIIKQIPPPTGRVGGELRALIFDSFFDQHRGVVAYVRIVDGQLQRGGKIKLISTGQATSAQSVGFVMLGLHEKLVLGAGEIGYVITGFKKTEQAAVGDTITASDGTMPALPGYRKPKAVVFAEIYPTSSDQYPVLRDAISKLQLNDASLAYSPTSSKAFGFGFRLGLLGLLHLEIVKERLEREFDLDLVVTTPTVDFHQIDIKGNQHAQGDASKFTPSDARWEEPWTKAEILTPAPYIGRIFELANEKRAVMGKIEYIGDLRLMKYEMPLCEIIIDFYDRLKSVSSGYASLNYEVTDYRPSDLVELVIALNGEPIEALSRMVFRPNAEKIGRQIVGRLKELLPRQNIEIRIQALIGARIIAAERISALRKDVTAKLYGGDVTRKRKLLEKQAKGKKKMAQLGKVSVPSDVFIKVLQHD